MEINSELNLENFQDRSEFEIGAPNFEWKKEQKLVVLDACFDMIHRENVRITDPVYYVSVNHGDREFFRVRIPITKVYQNKTSGISVWHQPNFDLTTTTADTFKIRLLSACGRNMPNPGPWAVLIAAIV